jgi:hypothetical protein
MSDKEDEIDDEHFDDAHDHTMINYEFEQHDSLGEAER